MIGGYYQSVLGKLPALLLDLNPADAAYRTLDTTTGVTTVSSLTCRKTGIVFSQATKANQPKLTANGTLLCEGSQWLSCANQAHFIFLHATTGWALLAAVKPNLTSGSAHAFMGNNGGAVANKGIFMIHDWRTASSFVNFPNFAVTRVGAIYRPYPAEHPGLNNTINNAAWNRIAMAGSGANIFHCRLNALSTAPTTGTVTATNNTNPTSPMDIGRLGGSTSFNWRGEIGQVKIFGGPLTGPQLTAQLNGLLTY